MIGSELSLSSRIPLARLREAAGRAPVSTDFASWYSEPPVENCLTGGSGARRGGQGRAPHVFSGKRRKTSSRKIQSQFFRERNYNACLAPNTSSMGRFNDSN